MGTGAPGPGVNSGLGEHPALMQELQARALAQAAAAAGLSPSAAMAALPMLPNLQEGLPVHIVPTTAVALIDHEEVIFFPCRKEQCQALTALLT